MLNRYTDCFGIITQTVPAKWLLAHPDAVGSAWTNRSMNTLIGGIDALVDGSKIILEYGSTGEKLVDPDAPIEVCKATYEAFN